MEETTDEIQRLRACINDLISVLAIPAVWSDRDPAKIASTLLDVLLRILRLDFAYARLKDPFGGVPIELARVTQDLDMTPLPQEIGQALNPWLEDDPTKWPLLVRNSIGEGTVSIVPLRLGLQKKIGIVVAGSRRADFRVETERLLLRIAANQAVISLQETRAHDELEALVAARTGELARANESLRRSETYLADAQRLSHMGSWAINIATREIVHLSEAHFRIFGFDPKDGMPSFETLLQRIHPNDRASAIEVIERGIRDRTDYEQDFRIVLPDGTMRSMHATGHPVFKSSGDPMEFVGTVIDVTERKRVEEELRRSEAYLTEAQRLSRTGSWAWNLSTGEVLWSREIYRIFGLDPDQTSLNFDLIVKLRHPEDRALAEQTLKGAVRERRDFEFESRIVLPDGSIRHLRSVGRPVINDAGALVEFVGAVMDVTEGKTREEALRKSQADLAHVTRVATLGEMSASIAHEINQPLTAAVTSASACLRWFDAQKLEEARRSASQVIAEVHRASEIIGRIRALTKKAPPQKDWLDINETIHEVIALARSEIQRNNIALETQLSDDVPIILADRIQLQQVILNLMMNAIEAMSGVEKNARELLVRSATDGSQGVLVSVQDSGPGFDPESLDHLFKAFYTTKPQGLGMGLAISRSIIEAHGGRLWATTNAPRSAVFQFILPVGSG